LSLYIGVVTYHISMGLMSKYRKYFTRALIIDEHVAGLVAGLVTGSRSFDVI